MNYEIQIRIYEIGYKKYKTPKKKSRNKVKCIEIYRYIITVITIVV